jgi:hypothetical protein
MSADASVRHIAHLVCNGTGVKLTTSLILRMRGFLHSLPLYAYVIVLRRRGKFAFSFIHN